MRIVAWVLAGGLAAWALMRVAGLDRAHPLVAAVSFTPYVAAAGIPVMALLGAARQWRPLALAAVASFALAVCVLPRAIGTLGTGEGLRVLSVNASVGEVPPEAVVEIVRERGVHLLSVQELTPEFDAGLRAAGIEGVLHNDVVAPVAGASGTGLYAKLPLRAIPKPQGSPFEQVAARTRWEDTAVEVVSVHPPPPVSAQHVAQWHETFRGLPRGDRPRILAGDFNATLDHRALRRLIDSGYADAADATGNGLRTTWPAGRGLRPGIVIDHILSTSTLRPVRTEVIELPRGDHRAVYAELVAASPRD